ncbi:MAG: signal peptidase I [Thermoanaerobaculia bacterium]
MTKRLWSVSLVAVIASFAGFLAVVLAEEGLRAHTSTSAGMAPLIPMNAVFYSRPPGPSQRPQPGDVVVFVDPTKITNLLVKRVVAFEGDQVEIRAKQLLVNGVVPVEPYVLHSDPNIYPSDPSLPPLVRLRDYLPPTTVGAGEVFVLGDNRDESVDSRVYGPVMIEAIVGYVVLAK